MEPFPAGAARDPQARTGPRRTQEAPPDRRLPLRPALRLPRLSPLTRPVLGLRTVVTALAVVATSTGCVRAVPGTALAAPAPEAAPFDVQTLTASAAPARRQVQGAVDEVRDLGTTLSVEGWAPGVAGRLVVVTDVPLALQSQRRLERPDAAQAVGVTDDALGFRLVFDKPVGAAALCVLFEPSTGPVSQLAGAADGCPA